MYDSKKVVENVKFELNELSSHYVSAQITTGEMLAISNLENQISSLRDIIYAKYNESDAWAQNNYLSAKSAIIHETHQERRTITKSITRGKLLKEHPSLCEALHDNLITSDHLDLFSKIVDSKYQAHLEESIDLLVENAIKFDALRFSYIIRHWKNIVDDQIDEPSDEYKKFENRRLFLNENPDGTWGINGQLDSASGMLVNKALENIANKLWRSDDIEQRRTMLRSTYRADALGYIAQGFINASASADANSETNERLVEFNFTPSLSADIVIDIENLNENRSTRNYLQNNLSKTTPIHKAHSTGLIKQLLCDVEMSAPLMFEGTVIDMGHKIRTASTSMKRQLALENDTCSIQGCSIPASWCDAHHIQHWADGGETKIENLALLCKRHHKMIHNDKIFEQKASLGLNIQKNKAQIPLLIRTG